MKSFRGFLHLAFLCLFPLHAYGDIPGLDDGSPLFPPTNSHRLLSPTLEHAAVQALSQLAPKVGQDRKSQRQVAIALARLGASDAALKITQNQSVQVEVRQMAARRSVFSGTLANARYWISQLPVASRAASQLQLARRLLLEKQPQQALEILRSIPPRNIESIQDHGDIALAFVEAGSKMEAQKRFELLDSALKKQVLATHEEGTKQLIESDMAFLAIYRLRAGLPLPADALATRGEKSLIYVLSFYFDAEQESPIREILELLPPTKALDILSGELLSAFSPKNNLRYKLVREWLSKISVDKRTVYVQAEVRELMWRDTTAALKLIEEFLAPNARHKLERQVRWSAVLAASNAAEVPSDLHKQWATQFLRELQIQRQQQLKKERDPDSTLALYGTLAMIVEVALVLEQEQTAQNALYEREKWHNAMLAVSDDEQAQAMEEELAYDWERMGNAKRAALWQQKMKRNNPKIKEGVLAQVRELIRLNHRKEAATLLQRISTKEWKGVNDNELHYLVWLSNQESSEAAQKQLPNWTMNLATTAQKVAVLSEWTSYFVSWENMRWARVGEKMG